ncbi:hypothetical protein KI387_013716, partial [Taxus chinensis]
INDNRISREAQVLLVYRGYISVTELAMSKVECRLSDPDIPGREFHSLQEPMVKCCLNWIWRSGRYCEYPDPLPFE